MDMVQVRAENWGASEELEIALSAFVIFPRGGVTVTGRWGRTPTFAPHPPGPPLFLTGSVQPDR